MFINFQFIHMTVLIIFMSNNAKVSGVEFNVNNAAELRAALNEVNPGDQIHIQKSDVEDSNYPLISGYFLADRNGVLENPIHLVGNSSEVGLVAYNPLYPALLIEGSHWNLSGFRIQTRSSTHGALRMRQTTKNYLNNLEIQSVGFAIELIGVSDTTIQNCKITSPNIGIVLGGQNPSFSSSRNQIVNNDFINNGEGQGQMANGSAHGIYIFSTAQDPACCGLIEGNRFKSESNTWWEYWIYLSGSNYLVKNNTGDPATTGGFSVGDGGFNNTFRLNHCTIVANGYCIELEPPVLNSTCIWSDNSYDSALGLSNKDEFCDSK